MAAVAALWHSPLSELEHDDGLRLLYGFRGAANPPRDVLIVAIDSASAKAMGLPERPDTWPRSVHARLVSGLAASGAAVIGFDMLFSTPRVAADDTAFASALRQAGNVVLAEAVRRDFLKGAGGETLAVSDQRILPLAQLTEAALATAPFIVPKTADGVTEFWARLPLAGDLPSLPMVMAQRLTQRAPQPAWHGAPARLDLNLYGPPATVPTLSYARALDLLAEPEAAAATFGGKAVLVGLAESNPSRQADTHRTPFSTADGVDLSGVELCATALGNLLEGSWLRRMPETAGLLLTMLYAGGLALPWAFARPAVAALSMLAGALGYALIAALAFAHWFVWLPVVMPAVFAPLLAGALGLAAHYGIVQRRRIELERAVEFGLPRQAMERLSAMLGDASEGRTALAICLCSDIVSYTTLAESLSPAATRELLNAYLARFIPVVERHGGYASDMVGDSVMSLWVAERDAEQTFRDACDAALELDRAMNGSEVQGALRTRFGLHCGQIYFGAVGGGGRREIRAVGDIVNTASRIEGANKYLGTRVLASGEVAARVPGFRGRAVGRFSFVGKTRSLDLVELVAERAAEGAEHAFAAGLSAFRAGQFGLAAEHFAQAEAAGCKSAAGFYLAQCAGLREHAPDPDWQGVVALPGK